MSIAECGWRVVKKHKDAPFAAREQALHDNGFRFLQRDSVVSQSCEYVCESEDSILEASTLLHGGERYTDQDISFRFAVCNPLSVISFMVRQTAAIARQLEYVLHDDAKNVYLPYNENELDALAQRLQSEYEMRREILQQRFGWSPSDEKLTVPEFLRRLSLLRSKRSQ